MGDGEVAASAVEPQTSAMAFKEDQEAEYQATLPLFLRPPWFGEKSLFLLIALGIAGYFMVRSGRPLLPPIGTLIAVIVLHELALALAMRAFGYRDRSVFFLPVFGAAGSGSRHGVARWKQGLVLVLGPSLGLVLGPVLCALGAEGVLRGFALQLVVVNAFSLLPVPPLAGGRLFSLLLFWRHRYLELGFLALAGLALIATWHFLGSPFHGALGLVVLFGLPLRKQVLEAANRLRAWNLPPEPTALDNAQRREIYDEVWALMSWKLHDKPRRQAALMGSIHEAAVPHRVSLRASVGLFGVWLAGIAISIGGVVAWVATQPATWAVHESHAGRFAIELPAKPTETIEAASVLEATRGLERAYFVLWQTIDDPTAWVADTRAEVLEGGTLLREGPGIDHDQHMVVRFADSVHHFRITAQDEVGYLVEAVAPDDEPDSERVVRSFRVLTLSELYADP